MGLCGLRGTGARTPSGSLIDSSLGSSLSSHSAQVSHSRWPCTTRVSSVKARGQKYHLLLLPLLLTKTHFSSVAFCPGSASQHEAELNAFLKAVKREPKRFQQFIHCLRPMDEDQMPEDEGPSVRRSQRCMMLATSRMVLKL